jgi:hypothetical protein
MGRIAGAGRRRVVMITLGMSVGLAVAQAGDLVPGARHPVLQLASYLVRGSIGQPGGLGLQRCCRLLHGGIVRRAPRSLPELLVALPAGSGANYEADRETDKKSDSISHTYLFRARSARVVATRLRYAGGLRRADFPGNAP